VSVHVPLVDGTRGLIGRDSLPPCSPAPTCSTPRGAIVDHEALSWALETGEIAGAGIDVF
jgi:lactate dehydrogenase-like 2-hydroxyacid dehydrogenase